MIEGAQKRISDLVEDHAEQVCKPQNTYECKRLASKEVSVATINKYTRHLCSIFNRAIAPRAYLAEGQNPFCQIKKRKVTEKPIRYVEISEYRALIGAANDSWWETFLSIAYGSGLRRNEILHLTWIDIDFSNQRININAKKGTNDLIAWEPKNRKSRVVPMSKEAVQLLANMQVVATEGNPYVFVTPQRLGRIKERIRIGKWNSRSELVNNITIKYTKIRYRANVAKCTIHDLRRSAITNWAHLLPIQFVQTLARHADIKTTRKYYLAVRPEDFNSAGKALQYIMAKASDI